MTKDSPRVHFTLVALTIVQDFHNRALEEVQQTAFLRLLSTALSQPSRKPLYSAQMLYMNTLQTIADALAYLQYYLQEVTKKQNYLETNIDNALSILTIQLQQLMQLVSSPYSPAPATALSLVSVPPTPSSSSEVLGLSQTFMESKIQIECFSTPVLCIYAWLQSSSIVRKIKVLWILIFFKGGWAVKQSQNLFQQKLDIGMFPLQTQVDFDQYFQTQFFPVNVETNAINTLEEMSYHQGNQIVGNYLDSFQALVSNTSYTDPQILVVKFQ